jgi:hypothetical protein
LPVTGRRRRRSEEGEKREKEGSKREKRMTPPNQSNRKRKEI